MLQMTYRWPLAAMAIMPREGDAVYGLVTLDLSGRIADRALIATMGVMIESTGES